MTPPGGFKRVLNFVGGKMTSDGEARVARSISAIDRTHFHLLFVVSCFPGLGRCLLSA